MPFTLDPYDLGLFPPSARAAIVRLLFRCGPVAIIRRVTGVVLAALNRVMSRWSRTHVGIEGWEIVPAVTNRDASAAIVLPTVSFRIGTAPFHQRPYAIFSRCSQAVCGFHRLHDFSMNTTAALRIAFSQTRRHRDCCATAIAPTFPGRFTGLLCSGDYAQTTKSSTSQIFGGWRHSANYTLGQCGN